MSPNTTALRCPPPQLALKHRKNRAGDERIMLFVGSPVGAKQKALNQQAVALRRTNVSVLGCPWRQFPCKRKHHIDASVRHC